MKSEGCGTPPREKLTSGSCRMCPLGDVSRHDRREFANEIANEPRGTAWHRAAQARIVRGKIANGSTRFRLLCIRPSTLPNCSSIIFLSLAGSFVRHGLKMRPLVRWRSSELFLPPSLPSAALGLAGLLDWRQGGDQLVVIFHHEINIGRKCHGVRRRFQF